MKVYYELLRRNPQYARLWAAQAISLLGDWFSTIVLATLVSDYSHGSGLAISLLLLCRFLPPVIVGPLAGVLVDRFDRKRLLILSDVARVVVVLGFLLADSPDHLWLIYLFSIIQFSISAVFEPGRAAFTPSIVPGEHLVQANMLGSVTWSVMSAVGGVLGGAVAGLFGTSAALVFDSATFAVSALLISQITLRAVEPTGRHGRAVQPRADFVSGLRYVRQRPEISTTLMVKAGSVLGSMDTLMIIYATSIFVVGDKGAGSLGLFWGAYGLGAVLGPLLFERFSDGAISTLRCLITYAFLFGTAGWVIFGAAPTLGIAALGLMVRAMGGTYWTYSSVILQRLVDDDYLGRVFSLDLMCFQLSLVVSIIVTGVVLNLIGSEHVRAVVFGTAVISVLPMLAWIQAMRWLNRQSQPALAQES
jgi:MFS family permease